VIFLIASIVLMVIGMGLTNIAKDPPSANIGMLIACIGVVLIIVATLLYLVPILRGSPT
jgi:hypothetical protein